MHAPSLKRISLIIATALTTALVWASAKPWLESPFRYSGYSVVIWPGLALTLAAAVTGLAWLMLERPIERAAAILASWATFILFWSPDVWYVSMLPFFGGLWYLSSRRMRNDLTDRHKVRIATSLGAGMTPMLLGTFMMLSLGFYLLPAYRNVGTTEVSFGIRTQLEDAYSQPLVEQQLAQLPPSVQSQVKAELGKNVDTWVKQYLGPLGKFLPPLLAFGLFLVLWSVMFIFRELAIWLGALLFWVLTKTGFVRVEEKEVKAEVIVL